MGTLSTVEARNNFSEAVNRVAYGKERVTLTRRGKPILALVPLDDLRLLEILETRLDLEDYRQALAEWEKSGRRTVSWEELKKELG